MFKKLLVNRNTALLFFGQVISQAGDSIYQIALLWMVLELTGSRALTGLMASASFVPFLVFGLPAGSVADRFSRTKIMILADAMRFGLVLVIPGLYFLDLLSIPLLALLTFGIASFAVIFNPAKDAIIPDIAPSDALPHVNALIQTSWQFAVLLGPALAAFILPLTGVVHLFTADALTFLVSLVLILLMIPAGPADVRGNTQSVWADMLDGMRYAWKNPRVRMVILITALNNLVLMGPAIVGIPIFVRDVLNLEVTHYAWIEASYAGGMIIGAPLMAVFGKRTNMGRVFLLGVILDGITYFPMYFIRSFSGTVIVIFIHSIFIPMITVSRATLIQRYVPKEIRGRVFSLIQVCVIGGSAISASITGLLSEMVSMPTIYGVMAVTAAATALPGFFSPDLRDRSR